MVPYKERSSTARSPRNQGATDANSPDQIPQAASTGDTAPARRVDQSSPGLVPAADTLADSEAQDLTVAEMTFDYGDMTIPGISPRGSWEVLQMLGQAGFDDSFFSSGLENETTMASLALDMTNENSNFQAVSQPVNLLKTTTLTRGLPFLIDGLESPLRRKLFKHFTETTSGLLTTSNPENNPILTKIVPRSLHDPLIREALLCISASHLTKLQDNKDDDLEAEKRRMLAIAEKEQISRLELLDKRLGPSQQQPHDDWEAMLVASMLMCLYEVTEGTGDICWRIRLETARHIVK